ncbi:acyltransferase family protein [Geodermatophilus sp. SYSU D00815]
MTARKDLSVQSLRGLAVVLMVAGHVIGSDPTRGLQVGDDSLWRLAYVGLEDLRMPLFTTISGFVYALRPVAAWPGYRRLVVGKVRRLLVPLVTVGALLFALQLVVPGVNQRPDPADFWRVGVYGFEHLWFLQAIFLVFVLVGLLDATGALDRPSSWGGAIAAACVLDLLVRVPPAADVFSINSAAHLLPFFLLGLGLRRFAGALDRPGLLVGVLPAFAAVFALRLGLLLAGTSLPAPADRLLGLVVGLTGLTALFLLRRTLCSAPLAWLGGYAFGIYLLHVFGAAAARIALERAGVHDDVVLFGLVLAAGIGLPVLFERTLGRYRVVSWGLLGQRPPARPRTGSPAEVAGRG